MNETIGIIPRAFRRRGVWVACTLLLRAGLNFLGLAMLLPVLALALDAVRRRWPSAEVVATCATGGRPDMALSVLGLLAGYDDAPVWIAEDETTARILHAGESWTIEGSEGKTFSIIAIAPNTEASEHGLEWELDRAPLGLLADTGISNVVRGTAKIQVHTGTAIAYLYK